MDPPAQPPRGRAALLLKAMQMAKEKETKPGPSGEQAEEPPKPRGRAAMLAKLKAMSIGGPASTESVSSEQASVSVEATPGGSEVDVATRQPTPTPTTSLVEEEMEVCHFRGTTGKPLNVTANYIRLSIDKDKGVFEYEVKFDPLVDAKYVRVKLINKHIEEMGGVKTFDGGSCLYLPIRLPNDRTVFNTMHPIDSSPITMTVIYKKKAKFGDCIHLFNVLFKRVMYALEYVRVGRNFYDTPSSKLIPQHKLEILPGYAIAVDEYEDGLMICLDTQHRVLRTLSVLEYFNDIKSLGPERFRKEAISNIIGCVVITKYNNKTYVIHDILWETNPTRTFENSRGEQMSYIDYYQKQHGLMIMNHTQPLLLHVAKRKVGGTSQEQDINICLVPEYCHLTGLTDAMRSDYKVMKDVAAFTRVSPHQRMHALRIYMDNVKKCPPAQKILSDWGVRLADATIDLNARVLAPEIIYFGGGGTYQTDAKADWTGGVGRNSVVGPVDVTSWIIIFPEKEMRLAQEFASNMVRLGKTMGCNIQPPRLCPLKNDRTHTFVQTTTEVMNDNVQLIQYIVQSQRQDLYSAIKRLTTVQHPVATQFVLTRNLSNQKKVRTVTLKIALQINCKLGGSLWALKIPVKTWMVCGIDVFHSPGSKMSVCAMVSSTNETVTSFYTTVIMQEKELSDQLRIPFLRCLIKFREKNGVFPKQVVIYRDGVGDGQLAHVLQYECKQFEEVAKELDIPELHICMVIVQKRINTRIISKDSSGNPPPGAVLDHTITRRNRQDFYLVPQSVTQGTVTPTHYIVLYNSGNLKAEHIQKLTYKMCHLYYNWSGTIRVPATCQYAHKAAFLVGQHIGKVPSEVMNDKLYYL